MGRWEGGEGVRLGDIYSAEGKLQPFLCRTKGQHFCFPRVVWETNGEICCFGLQSVYVTVQGLRAKKLLPSKAHPGSRNDLESS